MVQVDVFWAYGLGATFAAASAHLIKSKENPFESSYFVKTILFLALVWVPTGSYLLLKHPSWETMQAAETLYSIPFFISLAFGFTNITQGLLGFWVTYKFIEKGKNYLAQMNWLFGYFGLFFILIYGWDGLGYDRFVYDRDMIAGSPAWTPGVGMAEGFMQGVINFVSSSVFVTLMIDGLFLFPIMAMLCVPWFIKSNEVVGAKHMGAVKTLSYYALSIIVIAGGAALFCAGIVYGVAQLLNVGEVVNHGFAYAPENITRHVLSYFIGLPLGLTIFWFALLKEGRLLSKLVLPLSLQDTGASQVKNKKGANVTSGEVSTA